MIGKSLSQLSVTPRIMLVVALVLCVSLLSGTIFINGFVRTRMTVTYLESVETLFSSLQEGVRDSLERGQMRNFEKLLLRQKEVKGVLDVSLYDRQGTVNLSSAGSSRIGTSLEPEIWQRLAASPSTLLLQTREHIRILEPQVVIADCIRCHPNWQEQELGGVLSLSYDLTPLNRTLSSLQMILLLGTLLLLLLTGVILYLVMRKIVTKPVMEIADQLTGSSSQIEGVASQAAAAGDSLAQNAARQAASLEETSASLEEIAAMTATNAENAASANTFMAEANQVMADASQKMQELTEAMGSISQANEATGKIVKSIDEIAFQTNLLALNAAVEAARAGEAGAGFAVVAQEVRNLAGRAAEAARETTHLLEQTSQRVSNGAELMRLTGDSFSEARGKTGKTAGLLKEIASASGEQSTGVEQVVKAIYDLDKVTQQNAADADQAAAIAREMEVQSARLQAGVASLVFLARGARKLSGNRPSSALALRPETPEDLP